jgi:aspartate ammonia-lyase
MMPVMAYNLMKSLSLLSAVVDTFAEKCVSGINVNSDKCRLNVENSLYMATALSPIIGYDRAAYVARKAIETGMSIREVVALEMDASEIPWEQL